MRNEGHSLPFHFILPWRNTPSGPGSPYYRGLMITDTPHSIGLLWTSDQPDAQTSTRQQTTLTTDIHAPGGIRTHNPNKQAAADPHLRQRGHRERRISIIFVLFHVNFRDSMSLRNGSTGSLRRVAGCKFQTFREKKPSLSSRVKCSHKEISSFNPEDESVMLAGNVGN